jgi:hypothetical protein
MPRAHKRLRKLFEPTKKEQFDDTDNNIEQEDDKENVPKPVPKSEAPQDTKVEQDQIMQEINDLNEDQRYAIMSFIQSLSKPSTSSKPDRKKRLDKLAKKTADESKNENEEVDGRDAQKMLENYVLGKSDDEDGAGSEEIKNGSIY